MAQGRGRLSDIDRLPEEAEPHLIWADEQLAARKMSQLEILAELNARLADLSPPPKPISKSALNRRSISVALISRQMAETREIANVLAERLDEGGGEAVTLLLGETIKTLTFKMLRNAGDLKADKDTANMLAACGRALKTAEESRLISAEVRKRIERDFKAKVETAIETVAEKRGLSAETATDLKATFLGIGK